MDYIRHATFAEYPVINPGSLSLGEYGVMKLFLNDEQEEGGERFTHWHVSEATKKFLPSVIWFRGGDDGWGEEMDEFYANMSHEDLEKMDFDEDEFDDDSSSKSYLKDKAKPSHQKHKKDGGPRHFTHGVSEDVLSSMLAIDL